MALDEISPFRPTWDEDRAFRKLYFGLASAQVRRMRFDVLNFWVIFFMYLGSGGYAGQLRRGRAKDRGQRGHLR